MISVKSQIKVLQFVPTLQAHGVENYAINFFNELCAQNVAIDFCVMHDKSSGYYEEYLLSKGSHIYKLQYSISAYNKFCNQIKKILMAENYDIVHINCGSAIWYVVAKIAKQCGVRKVIYHSHNTSNSTWFRRFAHKLFRSKLNKYCDVHLACSDAAGKHMFNKSDYIVLKNAIPLSKFNFSLENRTFIRNKYNIQDKLLIGHVGRYNTQKNQIFLLQVVKNLKNVTNNFVVMLIGDGDDKRMLIKFVEDNNLSQNVIFIDNVGKDINMYYSAFDVLAFPSLYEGLSVVLIEAQANGLSIVASNTISIEHKIENNFIFLPIDCVDNVYVWAQEILNIDKKRTDNVSLLTESGYNIIDEASRLKEIYLS